MNSELKEQFFSAIMCLKKMESMFGTECEMQMTELAILKSITGECSCGDCACMNLNVPEIQEKLHISKPAVSYILNSLEKKAYITREIDPKDRRKISIYPTGEGRQAAQKSIEKSNALWEALLVRFGQEEMQHLVVLLTRLTEFFAEFSEDKRSDR